MLRRIDRILVRVPALPAAIRHYRDVLGLRLVKEDKRLASFRFPEGDTELVIHTDPDLPAEATYYLVDDVRDLFARRAELKLQFVHPPAPVTRGFRSAVKDPFGNVMLLVDRTAERADAGTGGGVIEDAKSPGALFPGVEETAPVKKDLLVKTYEEIGRTADDLPYTPDFEKLFAVYCAQQKEGKPTRQDVWRHLLNLRKGGKLPKLGDARSKPPTIEPEEKALLRKLVGEEIGRRDRLPYTDTFDKMVDRFNKGRMRPVSPHLVWRLVATLAK